MVAADIDVSMASVPTGLGAQLVEKPALFALTRPLVGVAAVSAIVSALCQRQSHPLGVRAHFQ